MTILLSKRFTIHYTLIQILYFTGFSVIFTYAAVFLRDRGFYSQQIGLTLALANLMTLFAQPATARWIERSVRFQLHHISAILTFCLIAIQIVLATIPPIFLLVLIFYVLTLMLLFVIQTLLVSMSLKMINRGIDVNFGLARGLGAGAFAVVSFGAGYLIEWWGTTIAPVITGISALLMAILILLFHEKDQNKANSPQNQFQIDNQLPENFSPQRESLSQFFARYPQLPLIFLGLTFVFANHYIYASYTINIVEKIGGSSRTLGQAALIGSTLEIPVMAYFYLLSRKMTAKKLLGASTLFFVVKTFMTWLSPNVGFFLATQVLQAGAFAVYLPSSVFYMNSILEDKDIIRGSAYWATACTLGGIAGNLVGGLLIDLSSVSTALLTAVAFGIIGSFFVITGTNRRI